VANNLAASTLWHKLIVLNPPEELIREIQRMLVNFFWNGQHWLREAVLYLPLSEGGQGLMDLKSKVAAFRLQIAQRILYSQPQNWINIACALLKRVGRMNLDKHLFLMNLKEVDFNGLTSFYASVFNVWQIFMVKRELSEVTYDWVLEEPLIFNPLFSNGMLQSKGISASFVKARICKIGHLRIWDKWITAEELALKVGIHSVRTVEHFLTEIQEYVMALTLLEERVENVFPSIRVGINVGDWQEGDGRLLSFTTPEIGFFDMISKKSFYMVCVKVLNLRALQDLPETKWTNFVETGTSPKGSWRTLYKKPIEKRIGDLQWRISHWIMATNCYKVHLNVLQREDCLFCGLPETVFHMFIGCPRLMGLFGVF